MSHDKEPGNAVGIFFWGIEWSSCWKQLRPHKQAGSLISANICSSAKPRVHKFEFVASKMKHANGFQSTCMYCVIVNIRVVVFMIHLK